MSCVLWRQHRAQLMWAALVVAVYGVFMVIVGHSAHVWLAHYHQWLAQVRAAGCPLPGDGSGDVHVPSATCRALLTHYRGGAQSSFATSYNFAVPVFEEGLPLVMVLIAVLVGAPVVAREVEQRTQLVAWTQSVARRRWYAAKTAGLAVGIAAVGLIAGVANDRLQIPLSAGGLTSSRWPWFFSIDLAPAAEAIAAFALAVALGAWLRRTLPAIGAALVGFLALFLLTGFVVRSMTPLTRANGPRGTPDDSWLIGSGQYHPASQYWPLQLTYLVLLIGFAGLFLVTGWRATRARAVV
jgi:ABC-2 family transporter